MTSRSTNRPKLPKCPDAAAAACGSPARRWRPRSGPGRGAGPAPPSRRGAGARRAPPPPARRRGSGAGSRRSPGSRRHGRGLRYRPAIAWPAAATAPSPWPGGAGTTTGIACVAWGSSSAARRRTLVLGLGDHRPAERQPSAASGSASSTGASSTSPCGLLDDGSSSAGILGSGSSTTAWVVLDNRLILAAGSTRHSSSTTIGSSSAGASSPSASESAASSAAQSSSTPWRPVPPRNPSGSSACLLRPRLVVVPLRLADLLTGHRGLHGLDLGRRLARRRGNRHRLLRGVVVPLGGLHGHSVVVLFGRPLLVARCAFLDPLVVGHRFPYRWAVLPSILAPGPCRARGDTPAGFRSGRPGTG